MMPSKTNQRKLKNLMYAIEETNKGHTVKRPVIKGIVLSGGGAKGIAYAGMLKEMCKQNLIHDLTHLSGASAGAMSASFISLGMSSTDFEVIMTELNIKNLINLSVIGGRSDGARFRNVLELIYLYQIKKILADVVESSLLPEAIKDYNILQTKIRVYSNSLKTFNIDNLSDIAEFVNCVDNFDLLNDAFKHLPVKKHNAAGKDIENQRITFYDFKRLRNILSDLKKNKIKHLSVVTTNQSTGKLEIYNEDNQSNESIAEKVFQSGAHPLLFSSQKNAAHDFISDGGILDNMPSETLEDLGLNKQEILCVKVDSNSEHKSRIKKAMSHVKEMGSLADRAFDFFFYPFLGGAHKRSALQIREREKVFFNLGNMLYLNSADIKTRTIVPSREQINEAIENGEVQTRAFLEERNMTFNHQLTSMLFLGEDQLTQMMSSIHVSPGSSVLKNAALAQLIFYHQHILVSLLNNKDFKEANNDEIILCLKDIESTLLATELDIKEQEGTLALCLKQVDFASDGKLGGFLLDHIESKKDETHWLFQLLMLADSRTKCNTKLKRAA